ncbi:MAG: pullulanase-type alpha-1,6-glucosidase [Ardenticatenaceae bacterium]|nr:pullulanase-type alpha-1,6-glucosidase [Ardenticatenaceae bacterium]
MRPGRPERGDQGKLPHLADYSALKVAPADLAKVPAILKGQLAVSAIDASGDLVDATGVEIPGVLDDLYTYTGALGVVWHGSTPSLKLWAPTAKSVALHLFANATSPVSTTVTMALDPTTGVWSATGDPSWKNEYYLYSVVVYAPSTGQVEHNLVTDPYSISLSTNSQRSQIVDLNDSSLKPPGWDTLVKPPFGSPEDIAVYELHVRDFSVNDPRVPAEISGTFKAFTLTDTFGIRYLKELARAGVTHIHLLPSFDCATINEDKSQWQRADWDALASLPPDSEQQQALVSQHRQEDAFNWCYDPWHYGVPEGSYSTDPNGPTRILEFRAMVQALNRLGLRVVMDVVYNHTNAAGQSPKSVLDRIVPGYYHRLNPRTGAVEMSTCCPNTATEHNMMEKLMVDTLVIWAKAYKVDGFRFDLMGHHMLSNMIKVRQTLDALTPVRDGVKGTDIYIYGEGWNFGEVANNARGVNATQINVAGTGIGTFNDRLRDRVRGGNPFGDRREQGFATGLYYDPNGTEANRPTLEEQKARLLEHADLIRIGLAGNLRNYAFIDRTGQMTTGAQLRYGDQPAGYTLDPQENVVYVSAHDNETLFDAIQFKAPISATMDERVRMQDLGLDIVSLAQGIHFFHTGSDMLRSKSMDADSFDSGDWFNKLDFTYSTNNWGVGLPPAWAGGNESRWPIMRPRLANPALKPASADILKTVQHFREMQQIRMSSKLFRLETGSEIQERLRFYNTGPDQIPGLIVMSITDTGTIDLDPAFERVVVLFNATDEEQTFQDAALAGWHLSLHPVQRASSDPLVESARYDVTTGRFTVPARTTAVFVEPEYRVYFSIVAGGPPVATAQRGGTTLAP